MIYSLLTDIALFVTFGAFLDKVFIGPEEREKIEKYLLYANRSENTRDRFIRFLQISHSIVFDRFFSGRYTSRRFFKSALTLSITSFSCIVATQLYFYHDSIKDVNFDPMQISLISFFVLSNFVFDYFTIIQTKIFVEAAINTRSIIKSAVLIFSDLIVTMNTFIIFYALIILTVVQFFTWPTEDIIYYRYKQEKADVRFIENVPDYLTVIDDGNAFARLRYRTNFSGMLEAKDDSTESVKIFMRFETTMHPEDFDFEKIIMATSTPLNISVKGDFQQVIDEKSIKITRDIFKRGEENIKDENSPPIEEIVISVNRRILNSRDFDIAYSEAYRQSDALEDGFPMTLIADLGVIYLDDFIADTVASRYEATPIAICLPDNGTWFSFAINKKNIHTLENCTNYITIDYIWEYLLTRNLSIAGRNVENRIVPYNTLLITSLLPTCALYTVIALFAISTRLFSSLLIGTAQVKKYVLRAPLAVASFFVSIPYYIYSIWN